MLAVKSMDVRENFKSLCDKVFRGETLIVSRPKNENIVMVASSLSIISSAFERILKPLVLMPFAGIAVAMGAGGHEVSRSTVQFLKTFFGFCISGAMMVVIIKTGCVMCTELVSDALYGTNDIENCIMITVQAAITPIVIAGLVKGTDGMIQRMF